MAEISRILCWLPLALAGCFLIMPYLAKLKKLPGLVWAILALILALALPTIIEILPAGWFLPGGVISASTEGFGTPS